MSFVAVLERAGGVEGAEVAWGECAEGAHGAHGGITDGMHDCCGGRDSGCNVA